MDGLLLDTEDIYTLCNNVILHQCGRPSVPWNIKAQLQGRPGPEVCLSSQALCNNNHVLTTVLQAGDIFHAWAQLPISREEYMVQISALQRMNFPSAQPLPGVPNLLADLEAAGINIALATSSHAINYKLKTSHLQSLFSYFPARNRVLGDDSRIPKGRGKPAPDIYLLALETINAELREKREKEILPEECLVFEDSVPGVEAGRRAGMRVIWCPHPELYKIYKGRQKEVLAGITGMSNHNDEEVEELLDEAGVPGRVKARHGAIDDGWAERLTSLVHFPYKKYGIKV